MRTISSSSSNFVALVVCKVLNLLSSSCNLGGELLEKNSAGRALFCETFFRFLYGKLIELFYKHGLYSMEQVAFCQTN